MYTFETDQVTQPYALFNLEAFVDNCFNHRDSESQEETCINTSY